MDGDVVSRWPRRALAMVGAIAALWVSVDLRLADPRSSPVLPAEDTYTHMALVREHLRDGHLDSLNPGGVMYPPGLHAYLAAAWSYTGADLYALMQYGPVLFGALGVLGMAFFLYRNVGLVASIVGSTAYAVAPEVVFRTTMMAPTALDLAILPFYLHALVALVAGRLPWAWAVGAMSLFLVFAHPWLLMVMALAGVGFVVLARLLPAPGGSALNPVGIGLAAALLGGGIGLSLTGCGGTCGPGMRDIVQDGQRYNAFGPIVAALSLLPLILALVAPATLRFLAGPARPARSPLASWIVGTVLLGLVLSTFVLAQRDGLPPLVNLGLMFGTLLLLLSLLGLLALAHEPSPGGHAGAALALTTFPFVVFNPLDSPFWSHRTAVYMGVGLVVLAAVAAAWVARLARLAWQRELQRDAGARPLRAVALAVPVLLVALTLSGTVYAATPRAYSWYRLYTPCEHDALWKVADNATLAPQGVVVTGAWQSKLVVAALAENASRIWFSSRFFTHEADRRGIMAMAGPERPLWVVVDKHLNASSPGARTDFLDRSPWKLESRSCTAPALGAGISVYRIGGTP